MSKSSQINGVVNFFRPTVQLEMPKFDGGYVRSLGGILKIICIVRFTIFLCMLRSFFKNTDSIASLKYPCHEYAKECLLFQFDFDL